MQSPEYPDLKWIEPKSWTNANRPSVQLIVIHTTEGSSHSQSAEDGATYNARRTDGTSAHYFHDSNSTVQGVRTNDVAHCARRQGNLRGIQHELCARAGWSDAQWNTDYANAMLRRAAKQAARDVRKWGIPVRHLTVAQVRDGAKGFCGHYDITRAFPQDNGTHTDPGPKFPWSKFLDLVRAELAPEEKDDDMPTAKEIATAVWTHELKNAYSGDMQEAGTILRYVPSASWHQQTHQLIRDLTELIRLQGAEIARLAAGEDTDDAQMQRIEVLALEIKSRVEAIPPVPPVGEESTDMDGA